MKQRAAAYAKLRRAKEVGKGLDVTRLRLWLRRGREVGVRNNGMIAPVKYATLVTGVNFTG